MRSRFAAFMSADAEWLLASWHRSTRPTTLDLTENPRWRGLQIVSVEKGGPGDDTAVVEFRATYLIETRRNDTGLGVLHERSRFVREDGRWLYLDGEFPG